MKKIHLVLFLISFNFNLLNLFAQTINDRQLKTPFALKYAVDAITIKDLENDLRQLQDLSSTEKINLLQLEIKKIKNSHSNSYCDSRVLSLGNLKALYVFPKNNKKQNILAITYLNNPQNKNEIFGADEINSGVVALKKLAIMSCQLPLIRPISVIFSELDRKNLLTQLEEPLTDLYLWLEVFEIGHDSLRSDQLKKYYNRAYFSNQTNQQNAWANLLKERSYSSIFRRLNEEEWKKHRLFVNTSELELKKIPFLFLTNDYINDPNNKLGTKNDFVETINMNSFHDTVKSLNNFVLSLGLDIVK